MTSWWQRIRAWWLRRVRGFVAAPRRSGGTSWQQHPRNADIFICRCGEALGFSGDNYFVRSRNHIGSCDGEFVDAIGTCHCPVTDARYVKICPQCGLGHWKDATPKLAKWGTRT